MNKDQKLVKQIIECKKYDDDTDELIDDFISEYDSTNWCRGWYKTMIWEIVEQSRKKYGEDNGRYDNNK